MKTIIVKNGRTLATFEFDANKAMDWITQKGLYIENRVYVDGNVIWVVKDLPTV